MSNDYEHRNDIIIMLDLNDNSSEIFAHEPLQKVSSRMKNSCILKVIIFIYRIAVGDDTAIENFKFQEPVSESLCQYSSS